MVKKTSKASVSVRPLFVNELKPGVLSAELIGTFLLTIAVLATSGNVIVAALTLLVLILVFSQISGAHVNPAVTLAMLATKQISFWKAFGYIAAQLLGAMLALIVMTKFMGANTDPNLGAMEVYKLREMTGTWVPVFAEALGALILGLGVASVVLGKRQGIDAAFAIGGALLIGLVLATLGSPGVLNPAVALGASGYTGNWWTLVAYAVAPVVGATLGAWLFKLMQWDANNGSTVKK